jgi:predicted outer membrane repeat protein
MHRLTFASARASRVCARTGSKSSARHARMTGLLLLVGLCAQQDAFAYRLYTVGADPGCSFNNVQDAIDNAIDPDGNSVLIAQDLTYTDQHVVIAGQSVALLGGLAHCDSSEYQGQTTLHGGSGHSVIEIEGDSHVYFGNLVLTGAVMDESHSGGGIYFGGQGSLEMANTSITFNTAGYGGAIDVSPSGPTSVKIDSDTLILSNTALVSGGGIRIEGETSLYVLQPQTFIAFNEAANGYGGGIEVIGPAAAYIGSPGYNGAAVIFDNSATYGGGMAVIGGSDFDNGAYANLFTTDPSNPVQVANNLASNTGGAIYLKPTAAFHGTDSYSFGLAYLCAFDFRMDDNIAQEGSAIYGDTDSYNLDLDHIGAAATLTTLTSQGCDFDEATQTHLGEAACADGVACNTMDRNVAEDGFGNPTPGSTILMQTAGGLTIYGLHLELSQGAHAIRTFDTTNDFQNCLVSDGLFSDAPFVFENEDYADYAHTDLRGCTIAGNQIDSGPIISSGRNLLLDNSLFDQPGVAAVVMTHSASLTADYVMADDTDGLPAQDDIVQASPLFVDAANGDYHLQRTSPGVDFAPAGGGTDLDRHPHDVDLGDIPNVSGPRDLGAYEIQDQLPGSCYIGDTIYCNGFDP